MSTTLPIAETEYIVQIAVNSAVILSILLALCVCREKPRFHFYLLLLANLFGVIYSALCLYEYTGFQNYNIEEFDAKIHDTAAAVMVFTNLSFNFNFLVGFFALQQLTKTYLGGTRLWIKVASTLASLWTIAILILCGVTSKSLLSTNVFVVLSIFKWGTVALCALLLLVLIGIRITYNSRVPSGKARRQVVSTFALVGFYILLLTLGVILSNVLPYGEDEDSIVISSLVVDTVFFRAPGFLFAIFYRRLSAMLPYVEQTDVEYADVEPLKA